MIHTLHTHAAIADRSLHVMVPVVSVCLCCFETVHRNNSITSCSFDVIDHIIAPRGLSIISQDCKTYNNRVYTVALE